MPRRIGKLPFAAGFLCSKKRPLPVFLPGSGLVMFYISLAPGFGSWACQRVIHSGRRSAFRRWGRAARSPSVRYHATTERRQRQQQEHRQQDAEGVLLWGGGSANGVDSGQPVRRGGSPSPLPAADRKPPGGSYPAARGGVICCGDRAEPAAFFALSTSTWSLSRSAQATASSVPTMRRAACCPGKGQTDGFGFVP